jgi:peptide/nickel transport system substrate-binding protein
MHDPQNAPFVSVPTTVSRRRFLQILGAGASVGVLVACVPAAPAQETTAPAAAEPAAAAAETAGTVENGMMRPSGTPKRGGTLRTAFGVTTAHYDVHQGGTSSILCQVYNTLVRRNLVDGLRTVIPDLAESWEVAEDGLTYTFVLRQGVKFHDGTPFTADDVVASFSRILNPPEGIVIPIKADLAMVASVEKVDDFTVKFNLSSPRAYFLDLLAGVGMVIYAKKTLDENNNDLRELLLAPGTGAFKFVEYKTAEKWTFERNPEYWDSELPYLDKITSRKMEPVTTEQIYWGAVPFVVIQMIMVALVLLFPQMVMHYKSGGHSLDDKKTMEQFQNLGTPDTEAPAIDFGIAPKIQ